MCPSAQAKQDCLDKHVLEVIDGTPSAPKPGDLKTRFYPRYSSRIYEIQARLPPGKRSQVFFYFWIQIILVIFLTTSNVLLDVEGGNCLLQWRYVAGNNWGVCEDGKGAFGCGPQGEFRACADITIGKMMILIHRALSREVFRLESRYKFKRLISLVLTRIFFDSPISQGIIRPHHHFGQNFEGFYSNQFNHFEMNSVCTEKLCLWEKCNKKQNWTWRTKKMLFVQLFQFRVND